MEDAKFATPSAQGLEDTRHFAVVGSESGKIFGYVRHRYCIAQDKQIFGSLADSLEADGIEISGSFWQENGETKLALMLGNTIELSDSDYRYMLIARNSYNGEVAWSAWSALMRQICTNGLMGIKGICGNFHQKHIVPLSERIGFWQKFIHRTAEDAPKLSAIIDAKSAEIVPNLEYVLRGAGFGSTTVKQVINNFDKLVPEAVGRPVTVWDAYSGVTNLYSNRAKGNWATNAEGLEQAAKLLETPLETLIIRGREALRVVATP